MCNELHLDSTPIDESGFGWKIFKTNENKELLNLTQNICFQNGEAEWNEEEGWGFCFFLAKEEALRAKGVWEDARFPDRHVVKQIAYRGGLGKHQDQGFMSGYSFEIALCTEFKVLEES